MHDPTLLRLLVLYRAFTKLCTPKCRGWRLGLSGRSLSGGNLHPCPVDLMSSALLRAGAEMAVVDPRILPEARPVFDAMLRDSSGNAIALFQVI